MLRAGDSHVALFVLWAFLGLDASAAAVGQRETVNLNTGWRFQRQTVPGSDIE